MWWLWLLEKDRRGDSIDRHRRYPGTSVRIPLWEIRHDELPDDRDVRSGSAAATR